MYMYISTNVTHMTIYDNGKPKPLHFALFSMA